MKFFGLLALVFFIGCTKTEETQIVPDLELQAEIQRTLAEDRRNKELELTILKEIRVAQENQDEDAFEFYLEEYFNVPRLNIPEEWKSEPGYFEGGDKVKY